MTDHQANLLGKYAKELLPRTTDRQAALLAEALAPYDFDAAKAVLKEHALSEAEQRLNLPVVMERVRARSTVSADARRADALAAELAHRERERLAKAAADASLEGAREFCAAHADELDEWRRAVLDGRPFIAKRAEGKGTLDSPELVCLIFEQFGPTAAAGVPR